MQFRIFEHDMVDSTSERAFAALAEGTACHGDVHVARGQIAGRGRRGAAWASDPGAGLYASVVLRTARVLEPAALTMGAGLAVRSTLLELGLARAQLKWPNDLLIDGAKLCGILAETRGLVAGAPHAVLGIGINVAQRNFPAELSAARLVTSLALCGVITTPRDALDALLPHLEREIERVENDPEATVQAYFAASGLANRRVRVLAGECEIEGRWSAVDLAHGVAISLADGTQTRVRLEHVRALSGLDP